MNRPIEEIFKELINHRQFRLHPFSIVLDDHLDSPIVLELQREIPEEGSIFKLGDLRFEVSNGLPGDRTESFNFTKFSEAAKLAENYYSPKA